MDFFKSVFSAQPEPPRPPGSRQSEEAEEEAAEEVDESSFGDAGQGGSGGGGSSWGAFSGLIHTLVSKSEPLIQTYRRDLEEFGSGIRKETEVFREVIREIPTSIEAKASVAQDSLGTVGHALDGLGASVWRGTAEIIAQGKDALLSLDAETAADLSSPGEPSLLNADRGASNRPSRFEVKLQAIQVDLETFSEEPEDAEEFHKWLAGFNLQQKEEEINSLREESRALQGNLARLVPEVIDYDTFWGRYFYKVHKMKQAEDLRANLVKRAISGEEEDLSWEVEDDDVEKTGKEEQKDELQLDAQKPENPSTPKREADENLDSVPEVKSGEKSGAEELSQDAETSSGVKIKGGEAPTKIDEKIIPESKGESAESCKDSDVSIVSTQPSIPEEDDLGWDEIEDLGDDDEKKVGSSSRSPPKQDDVRRRLTTAEDEEDLSWDIEDDDPKNS